MKFDKGYIAFGLVIIGCYFTCELPYFIFIASIMFLGLGISYLFKK